VAALNCCGINFTDKESLPSTWDQLKAVPIKKSPLKTSFKEGNALDVCFELLQENNSTTQKVLNNVVCIIFLFIITNI
jgi:hypothetical protein